MSWIHSLNQGPRRIAIEGCIIEILHWAYAPHLPDNVPHRHTYFEVCLVGEYGQGNFIVRGHPYPVGPGDLFIARPGVIHQIQNTATPLMELFWVSFTIAPPDRTPCETASLLDAFSNAHDLVVPDEGGVLRSLWQSLAAITARAGKSGYRIQQENQITSLLLAIAQAGGGGSTPVVDEPPLSTQEQDARLAIRYIQDNLDRRLPVSEVAAYIHVSPRHLSRLLNQFTGVSPAVYIEQARMDRALALLQDTALPLKAVAQAVGYRDVHHFARSFQRRYQMSPGTFRRGQGTITRQIHKQGALV